MQNPTPKKLKTLKPKKDFTERTRFIIDFDAKIRHECGGLLCGVDEAGRGPVAGPVVAAAVIFPDDVFIPGVFDSKKISAKQREGLFDEIKNGALAYGIGIVSSLDIDTLNILNATKLAMNNAVSGLSVLPKVIIADGNFYSNPNSEVRNIIKADEKSFSVAAASILAKVTRDGLMCEYENRYPNFTFSHHKGYGTAAHIEEILEFGYTDIHRRTFRLKAVDQLTLGV